MTDEKTINDCIAKYADNQKAKEAVGGEKQENATEILRVLVLVGSKITEVSFLKSIIKHNVFVVLTTFFLDENSNNHFYFLLGCQSFPLQRIRLAYRLVLLFRNRSRNHC